jgi:short-subunit dehydrogenase
MMDLSKQTILLTGATGGIGSSLAQLLVKEGSLLILQGRSAEKLAELKTQLGDEQIEIIVGDLSSPVDIACIAHEATNLKVTGLINNAGVNDFSLFEDSNIEDILTINVSGTMLLTQKMLHHFKQTDSSGNEIFILNVGSTFGTIGFPGYVAYSAAKHAIKGFSEALGRELADTDITVLYASPRATSTDMNSATIENLNSELGVTMDSPEFVASSIVNSIKNKKKRSQLGWTEAIQSKINSLLPGVVDSALAKQLPIIKKFIPPKL